jgi:lambda family phage portal protein
VDRLSVPLQIQVLEPELCPHAHTIAFGSAKIRAGVEFNAIGKRVAYWFHPTRPELDDYDASQLRRVPAESVIHLYDPLRPGQLRGLPHLTQALIELYELSKYRDAQLLRQQLSNMFVGFITREARLDGTDPVNPLSNEALEETNDEPLMPLAPGLFQELDPGEDVTFSAPPTADGYADFMRQQLYGVAAATGVPYEVITGDMRSVNDRTVRLILQEFRRRIQAWQHQIVVFQFGRRVWRTWMDRAALSGALPVPGEYWTNPDPWVAVEWKPQGWPYMNPVQDVQAARDEVRAGFRSRRSVVAERGDSVEVIDLEQAADNARADEMGVKYDSDGRNKVSAAATPAPPEPTDPAPSKP